MTAFLSNPIEPIGASPRDRSETPSSAAQRQPINDNPLLDCVFVLSPDELLPPKPGWVYLDEQSDPFTAELLQACLPEGALRGVSSDVTALDGQYVYLDGLTWERNIARLHAAGIRGQRARVLLSIDDYMNGFWDYAKACGPELRTAFATRTVPIRALSAYLEKWSESRVAGDRVLPAFGYNVRDYPGVAAANAATVLKVLAALADDESRATYARILFGSNEQVLAAFGNRVFGTQQYLEVVAIRPGDHIVNCGVGIGFELPFFLAKLQGRGIIYNFDPNIGYHLSPYKDFIEHFRENIRDHHIIIGDSNGEIALDSDCFYMVHSSDLAKQAGATSTTAKVFRSRTLDDLVQTGEVLRVDLIKLDVEGGELNALRGARNAIRRFRPRLAVAIYHEPDDFWRYPAELMDWLDGYRFYVRQYGYSRFETLLYAVPEEDGESRSGSEILVSAPPAATLPGRIHIHLLDEARRGYADTPGQVLTRCAGASWSTASLTAGPRVHVDRVVAIVESSEGRLFIAEHEYQNGRQVVLGGDVLGEVRWHTQKGLDQRQVVPIFGFRPDEAGFGEYDSDAGMLDLYGIAGGLIVWSTRVACSASPLLVARMGAVTHVICQPASGHISVYRTDDLATDPEEIIVNVSGDVVGCTTLEEFEADGAWFSPAILFRRPGERALAVYVLRSNGSMDCVGKIDFGGIIPVPTIVMGNSSNELPSDSTPEVSFSNPERGAVDRTVSAWRRLGRKYLRGRFARP